VSEESVVPVASKNTKKGEMPVPRTAFAFSVNEPLVAEHAEPLGGVAGGVTVTVTDCWVLPPVPVQLRV
jgi:hypothetical protein